MQTKGSSLGTIGVFCFRCSTYIVSSVQCSVSSVQCPVSSVQCPVSSVRYSSDIRLDLVRIANANVLLALHGRDRRPGSRGRFEQQEGNEGGLLIGPLVMKGKGTWFVSADASG